MALKYDWFISYARESEATARDAYERLKRSGRVYFFPAVDQQHDGAPPETIKTVLGDAIRSSRSMMVLLDNNHLSAEWCGWEIEAFRAHHGPEAPVFFQPLDFSDTIHTPRLLPWRTEQVVRTDAPDSLASLIFQPSEWSVRQGYGAGGHRLFHRIGPAVLDAKSVGGEVLRSHRALAALGWITFACLMLAICCAASWDLRLWERQLVLVASLVFAAGGIVAVLMDLPTALVCTCGAFIGSIATAWAHASSRSVACDGWVAGGSAAGIFVGLMTCIRLGQRASTAPRLWNWAKDAWDAERLGNRRAFRRGALSVVAVVLFTVQVVLRVRAADLSRLGISGPAVAAAEILGFGGHLSYDPFVLLTSVVVGIFLSATYHRHRRLNAKSPARLAQGALLLVPAALGGWLSQGAHLSPGAGAGLVVGAIAGCSVARSRMQTRREKLGFRAALPAGVGPIWRTDSTA
jgi:TIR domain